ncbi:MAG: FAD-dependent oxidoreductase [Planctomycetota bacterium]|jgi:phytoene dehydrogenase-like protein|nr:FAD-dependent oxidoreductase [Planctomycetota bacterium]
MAYDAVIIGAGPSGLAAAVRLAHFGKKVCLVEAHSRLGGMNSWHRVAGMEISSGLHAFTNYCADGRSGALGKLLRQLRVKFKDLELYPQNRSSIRFPSCTLAFDNGPELLRSQIAQCFPAGIDGFDRLRTLIRETDEGEITDRRTSAREVLESHLRDPLLVDMLFCPVMLYGNPGGVGDGKDGSRSLPDMDWLLFCVVWKCLFESGMACPLSGMRKLWETLAERFRADGGELILSARVARVMVGSGRAVGVRLEDGREFRADMIFSSVGFGETLGLVESRREGETADIPAGISIVEGVAVLDRPSASIGMEDTAIFFSLDDAFSFRRPAALVERKSGVALAMDNYLLPEPAKKRVLKMSRLANYPLWRRLAPEEYREAKTATALGMAADLALLGVRIHEGRDGRGAFGCFDDLFTPLTLERFTSRTEGALYGSPVKSRSGETPYGNLYLIGTDQGFHGIVGAMLSGVAMVNRHLLAR